MQAHWPSSLTGDDSFMGGLKIDVTDMSSGQVQNMKSSSASTSGVSYDYNSVFTSSVEDLDIGSYDVRTPPPMSDLTITPEILAKYKMVSDSTYLTPPSSTAKPQTASQLFLQPLTPPASQPTMFSSPAAVPPSDAANYNFQFTHIQPQSMSSAMMKCEESESDYFSDPSYSPTLDDFSSPQFVPTPQFQTAAAHTELSRNNRPMQPVPMTHVQQPAHPPISSSLEVFSSVNMHPVDTAKSNINWRPVVTVVPLHPESQELMRMQQLQDANKWSSASARRSCLPPGKVDSYMAGPNAEGLFTCLFPDCGKLFRRRYNVRSHIQTHLCDRPYPCESCGARFVRPHDLRRHEKCHQEERPHTCLCGRSFTRHDALQRHRNRQICVGGIETPGKPKRPPAKRGRPAKNRNAPTKIESTDSLTGESESDLQSPFGSPDDGQWS